MPTYGRSLAKVSKEKIEEMRDAFLASDTDNDGTVSLDEFKVAFNM